MQLGRMHPCEALRLLLQRLGSTLDLVTLQEFRTQATARHKAVRWPQIGY